jgi:hypothetical protein
MRLAQLLVFILLLNSLAKTDYLTEHFFRIEETAKASLTYSYAQVVSARHFSHMLKCHHMANNTFNVDFDLPEVASSAPTKPRIHMASESVCVSCEG